MNVLSAMAGINNGNFCSKFTKNNVDMITLGGFNLDTQTYNAGLENIKNGRKEFDIKPHQLAEYINKDIETIKNSNKTWKGKININVRLVTSKSLKNIENTNADIIEINAHCRQPPMTNIGAGQSLLEDKQRLFSMIKYLNENTDYEISIKFRANVNNNNMFDIIKKLDKYNVKYIHLDAFNPGIMEADYDIIKKVASITDIHLIGNNSITTRKDYENMLKNGCESVSIARYALNNNIDDIFK